MRNVCAKPILEDLIHMAETHQVDAQTCMELSMKLLPTKDAPDWDEKIQASARLLKSAERAGLRALRATIAAEVVSDLYRL